jgi:dolichyl-phosphate-mannose-protein mannosyltransferase
MLQSWRAAAAARTWRGDLVILLMFSALTAVVTYPQVRWIATRVPYSSDPYFSIWRLGWVAHAIVTNPRDLFQGNIFYPAPATLGYSDAMLLPGTITAPLFWAEINPVVIYNVAFLAAIVLSGWTAFRLARSLTGNVTASIVAGIIFAFTPYRFCHYMHLELQIVFWMPVALLLVHRVVEHGRFRDGVLLGLTMAAQLFSSIYMGVFSLVYLGVLIPVLFFLGGFRRAVKSLTPLTAGAVLAMVIVAPYALAYRQAEREVGLRAAPDMVPYSASLKDYMAAPDINRVYGWTAQRDITSISEMNLFPGLLACVLAAVGVVRGPGRARFAYLAGLIIAIEMTRGAFSPIYRWLFEHFEAFQALRAPARFNILVGLSLGVLSAYGAAFLLARIDSTKWRQIAGAAMAAALIVEYASSPVLEPAPGPTRVDSFLSRQPPSVIVELPLLSRKGFWGSLDSIYMAQGIGHFQKMLNGYSGHAPGSFYQMREEMGGFPDDRSMKFLQNLRVDYIVVRAGLYEGEEGTALLDRLGRMDGLSLQALWPDGPAGAEAIYRIKSR